MLVALVPFLGMDAFLHRRTHASDRRAQQPPRQRGVGAAQRRVTVTLAATELVPGDLVAGRRGRGLPGRRSGGAGEELQADESALTGEAYPVRKLPLAELARLDDEAKVDSQHWGFAGTRLLTGKAWLRVVHTGGETLYGEIVRSATRGAHLPHPAAGRGGQSGCGPARECGADLPDAGVGSPATGPRPARCPAERRHAGGGGAAGRISGGADLLPRRRRVSPGQASGAGAARGGGGEHRPGFVHLFGQDRHPDRRAPAADPPVPVARTRPRSPVAIGRGGVAARDRRSDGSGHSRRAAGASARWRAGGHFPVYRGPQARDPHRAPGWRTAVRRQGCAGDSCSTCARWRTTSVPRGWRGSSNWRAAATR